jgi:hypothetical protein
VKLLFQIANYEKLEVIALLPATSEDFLTKSVIVKSIAGLTSYEIFLFGMLSLHFSNLLHPFSQTHLFFDYYYRQRPFYLSL